MDDDLEEINLNPDPSPEASGRRKTGMKHAARTFKRNAKRHLYAMRGARGARARNKKKEVTLA